MTLYTRDDWRARPAKPGPGNLDPNDVVGIALHWPAMSRNLVTVAEVMAALRGWQNYHMDDRGWSDLAYQRGYDQAGNKYEIRGLSGQSGANGDEYVNDHYGAFLLILGPNEVPSAAMMQAVREDVAEHRRRFPKSKVVLGHNDVRPEGTACPGPQVKLLIDHGSFEPGNLADEHLQKKLTDLIRRHKKTADYAAENGRGGVARQLRKKVSPLRKIRDRVKRTPRA